MYSLDFILMEPAEAVGVGGGKWTDQETLLLFEALELYKENWNEIAEHVGIKPKPQCILHFIQMPIAIPLLILMMMMFIKPQNNSVWKYEGGKDLILRVGKEDYTNCSISNPIKVYNDGNTKVKLDRPDSFYFISGAKGHCEKGQKLIVVVMTPRGSNTVISNALSPAPSQNLEGGPTPSPTGTATSLKTCGLLILAAFVAMWFFLFGILLYFIIYSI